MMRRGRWFRTFDEEEGEKECGVSGAEGLFDHDDDEGIA